jgi:hypothetical protein
LEKEPIITSSPKQSNSTVAQKQIPLAVDSDLESVSTVVEVNKHKAFFDQLKQQKSKYSLNHKSPSKKASPLKSSPMKG